MFIHKNSMQPQSYHQNVIYTTKDSCIFCFLDVETEQQKAMSQMIEAIKKGHVHLKPTPKVSYLKLNRTMVIL